MDSCLRRSLTRGDADRLALLISERFGIILDRDCERRDRRISSVVDEMARDRDQSPDSVISSLLDGSGPLDELPRYITVGETYFFRERSSLNVLKNSILPGIASQGRRSLRIWCAGCSSGEEPYTIAMIAGDLWRSFPDGISVFGTDINDDALSKALRGVYGKWSFRGMSYNDIERYFLPKGRNLYEVRDIYRSMVKFGVFNLASPGPWPWGDGLVDVILCRNVMMYLDGSSRAKALGMFHEAVPSGGWLMVAPCEAGLVEASLFSSVHLAGTTVFKKSANLHGDVETTDCHGSWEPDWEPESDDLAVSDDGECGMDDELRSMGEIATKLESRTCDGGDEETPSLFARVRRLADRGALEDASALCLSEGSPTDPVVHYLMSMIHQEKGELEEAGKDLRRALFLDPSFAVVHYSLWGLALSIGDGANADRHRRNLREILKKMDLDAEIPWGDGLSAGDFLSALEHEPVK